MSFYRDFADVYERVFPVRDSVVTAVTDLLGSEVSSVLDVGCGPGHLCSRLESAGYDCTGIDLDGAMIARGLEAYPGLDLRELDMCRVGDLDGRYDAGLCLGNVMPHLDTIGVRGFLGSLHHELVPGAPWVVQTVNFDRLLGRPTFDFPPLEVGDGLVFERRYEDLDKERCRFLTRLMRDGTEVFAGEAPMSPWTVDQLHAFHRDAGFECSSIASDATGTPFDAATSAGRWIVYRRDPSI